MRALKLLVSGVLLAGTLAACKPAPFEEVRLAPAAIAARAAQGERVRYVDVRFADAYRKSHVKGAVLLTSEALYIDKRVTLPQDETLALYCSCGDDHMSAGAARTLYEDYGYRRLVIVKGGVKALQAAGLPMASGPQP